MNTCDKCGTDNTNNARYCSGCGYELPKKPTEEIQEPVKKKRDNKKLAGAIGVIVSFAAYFIVQQMFFKTPSIDKAMMAAASEMNKSCPIMVDAETRLDNTIALPSKGFQYNYTLINVDKESIDTVEIKKYIEPNIINGVRTSPDMKFQRDNKVTMKYYYKDKKGNYLFLITVTPEQYK